VNLAGNRFQGTIPSRWGELGNLQALYLAGNLLSGPVPTTFSALKKLSDISLAHNEKLCGDFAAVLNERAADHPIDGTRLGQPCPSGVGEEAEDDDEYYDEDDEEL